MTPSRQFLVTQAVLNAALPYADANGGRNSLMVLGTRGYLDTMTVPGYVRPSFCDQVRKEYRLLASRYSEAA